MPRTQKIYWTLLLAGTICFTFYNAAYVLQYRAQHGRYPYQGHGKSMKRTHDPSKDKRCD